jgi:hypothetical protein
MPTNTWTYTLDLSDFYHDDALTLAEKANKIAGRIEVSSFFRGQDWSFAIQDVLEEFSDFAKFGSSAEIFDRIMRDLYAYADDVRIWVKTREGM